MTNTHFNQVLTNGTSQLAHSQIGLLKEQLIKKSVCTLRIFNPLIVTDLACVQAQPISNNKDNKEFNLTCRNIAMFLDFSVDSSPCTCIYA